MTGPGTRLPVRGTGVIVVECIDGGQNSGLDDENYRKSSLTTLQNSYPVKIMVPSHASSSHCQWVYPITFGGGLVGGDSIDISIHVKEDCCVLLTGQESTKIYHCDSQQETHQALRGRVDDGGLLCILSDPVVCYKDSNFLQKQTLQMSRTGNLVYLDWMIGGRVSLDELWQLSSYQNKTDLYIDDRLVYRDNYHLSDTAPVSVKKAMGAFQVIGSCLILGPKLEAVSSQLRSIFGRIKTIGEKQNRETVSSVSPLRYSVGETTVSGVYIRFLATSSSKAYEDVVSKIVHLLTTDIGGNPFAYKYS